MIYVIHSHKDTYYKGVYAAIRKQIPDSKDIILPHETDEYTDSLPIIAKSDLVVLIAHDITKSFGSGVEVGYAKSNNIPIVVLCSDEDIISSSLNAVADKIFYYKKIAEIPTILTKLLLRNSHIKSFEI